MYRAQIPFGLKLVPVAIDEHGLVPASLDAIMTQWDAATQVGGSPVFQTFVNSPASISELRYVLYGARSHYAHDQ